MTAPATPETRETDRTMARPEMDSETGLEVPTLGRTLRLFGRALRLRCPNCGGGPVLAHWLKLRVKCGTCGLRLQRGEHDTFMGSVFILFTLMGLLAYAVITVALVATDATPWGLIETLLPVVVALSALFFFPFSKLLWLAFDLTLRPVTAQELEWHRSTESEFSTGGRGRGDHGESR